MKSLLASSALALSLALPAQAFDMSDMSEQDRAAFGEAVRSYLMENPQVIMEAVAALEAQQQEQAAQNDVALVAANREGLFDDGFSHQGGNVEGDITLVEFIDYRCGYCRRAHDEVHELVGSDGNIRLITKEFPILGPDSLASSQFAIAVKQVAGGEAYEAANNALIRLNGDVTDEALRQVAFEIGVDADAVLPVMDSPEVQKEIEMTRALAQRLNINGTPTFVLEDQMLRGYLPLQAMRQIVDEVRNDS